MIQESIHRISIPNPFFEGRNSVYLIRNDPITLIDTGVATTRAYEALKVGLKELGLRVQDIQRIILTHKHIDHIGNAWRIQQETDCDVYIHEVEHKAVVDVDPSGARFAQLVERRLAEWNAPQTASDVEASSKMPAWELESAVAKTLVDNQVLPLDHGELTIMHVPGHTNGSICVKLGAVLFSGDHVLENVSPNIGAGDMRRRGMLKLYLQSLKRAQESDGISTVMPGHGAPFTNLKQRCQVLADHHQERLEKIIAILRAQPQTVYQIACALFGELNDFHVMLGCAEANAHLEYLEDLRLVCKTEGGFTSI